MSQLEDLLRAVLDAPEDELIRLALADRLEEAGEPRAGELRQPGVWEAARGEKHYQPARLFWRTAHDWLCVGAIPERPRCSRCGSPAVSVHYGSWLCWTCAARETIRRVRAGDYA
jgi:uncharacterized protein (TIGR02996 family)